eukprot:2889028-Rhodomonas_salina.7
METAMKVQEVIEKQRQLHSEMEALAPPALLLGGASELADIARMFALLLPEEELSTEDMQALQQLLSPFRRKRCRISLTYPPGLLDIAHAGPFAVESSLSEEGGKYLAGSQIFAEGDLNQVIFFVLAGKSARTSLLVKHFKVPEPDGGPYGMPTQRGNSHVTDPSGLTSGAHMFDVAGTVSIRAGSAVLVTMNVGELVGERSFWGQGNRGKSAKMIAETDVEVQWLEYEVQPCPSACPRRHSFDINRNALELAAACCCPRRAVSFHVRPFHAARVPVLSAFDLPVNAAVEPCQSHVHRAKDPGPAQPAPAVGDGHQLHAGCAVKQHCQSVTKRVYLWQCTSLPGSQNASRKTVNMNQYKVRSQQCVLGCAEHRQ